MKRGQRKKRRTERGSYLGSQRRRETVRFAWWPGPADLEDVAREIIVSRATIVQREVTEASSDKKGAQLVSSPLPFREETVLPARPPIHTSSFRNAGAVFFACDLFFGEVKLSFISSGCNEAAFSLVGTANYSNRNYRGDDDSRSPVRFPVSLHHPIPPRPKSRVTTLYSGDLLENVVHEDRPEKERT